MVNWTAAAIGFILTVLVESYMGFTGTVEIIGLIVVGFIVGLLTREDLWNGMYSAIIAGAAGVVITAIIFMIMINTNIAFLTAIFGGIVGFSVSGLNVVPEVLIKMIYCMIIMGIAGGVGGYISRRKHVN